MNDITQNKSKSIVSSIFTFVCLWLLLVATVLLFSWTWPTTTKGWLVTLGVGPIVLIFFEILSELFQKAVTRMPIIGKLHSKYESNVSGQSISLNRIGYLFFLVAFVGILFVSVAIVSQKYAGGVLEPVGTFMKNNFK